MSLQWGPVVAFTVYGHVCSFFLFPALEFFWFTRNRERGLSLIWLRWHVKVMW